MIEKDLEKDRLHDSLSDVTRKERRFLLGTSLLGIAIVKTGLIPSKIPSLGIVFEGGNQRLLLIIIFSVILYFFIAFIIYGISDFLAWWLVIKGGEIKKRVEQYEAEIRGWDIPLEKIAPNTNDAQIDNYKRELLKKVKFHFKLVTPISFFRVFFDYVIPFLVGLYALIVTLSHHVPDSV